MRQVVINQKVWHQPSPPTQQWQQQKQHAINNNHSLIKFPFDHRETTHHDVDKELEKAQASTSYYPTMGMFSYWCNERLCECPASYESSVGCTNPHLQSCSHRYVVISSYTPLFFDSLLIAYYCTCSTLYISLLSNHSLFNCEEKQASRGRAQRLIMKSWHWPRRTQD